MARAPAATPTVGAADPVIAPPIPPRVHRISSGDPQYFDATTNNPSFAHLRQLSWDYGLSAKQLPSNSPDAAIARLNASTIATPTTPITAANAVPISRPNHTRHAATDDSPLSNSFTAPILVPSPAHNVNNVSFAKGPTHNTHMASSQPATTIADEQVIQRLLGGAAALTNLEALRRRNAPAGPTGTAADASLDHLLDGEVDSDQQPSQALPAASALTNALPLAIPGRFVRSSSISEDCEAVFRSPNEPPHDSFELLFGGGAPDAPRSAATELDENVGQLNSTYICESSDSNAESCTADLLHKTTRADNARKKRASSAEPELCLATGAAPASATAPAARASSPAGDLDSDEESLNSSRLNVSSLSGLLKRFVRHSFGVDTDSDDEKQERASIDSQRERLTIKDNAEFVGDSESSTPTLPPRMFKSYASASHPPESIPEAVEAEPPESLGSSLPIADATLEAGETEERTPNGVQVQPTATDALELESNGHCEAAASSELTLKIGSGSAKWSRRSYAAGGGDDDDRHVNASFSRFSNLRETPDSMDGAEAERADRRFGSGSGSGERFNKPHSSGPHASVLSRSEKSLSIALQVVFPFLIAGFGMVVAGIVLEIVRRWDVFQRMRDLDTIVPPLLGLKGNLEMTLASRLSTQANLGHLDDRARLLRMVGGNLALLEAQAICLSTLASAVAVVLGYIARGGAWPGTLLDALFLTASATCTAAVAAFVLGVVMVSVIVVSRKLHINPDNVATPVAGSLGDLTATAVLAFFASFFYKYLYITGLWWVLLVVVVCALLLAPFFVSIARRNPYTRQVVYDGWIPIVSAVCISNCAGWIYSLAGDMPEMTPFVPVMNGVGGNLAAIQASRLSTTLHSVHGRPGFVRLVPLRRDLEYDAPTAGPATGSSISFAAAAAAASSASNAHTAGATAASEERFGRANDHLSETALSDGGILLPPGSCPLPNPADTFCHPTWMHSRTARVLLALALPGHLLFALGVFVLNRTEGLLSVEFFFLYLLAVLIQVMLLLYMTHWLVQLLWRLGKDPDNFAIPYLTAMGDVIGTGLLTLAFITLRRVFNIRAAVLAHE